MTDDYDDIDDDADSSDTLPSEQQAFIDKIRHGVPQKEGDAYHQDLIKLSATIKSPDQKLEFYQRLSEFYLSDSKIRFYLADELELLGDYFQNMRATETANSCYLLCGDLSQINTQQKSNVLKNLKSIVKTSILSAESQRDSIEYIMVNATTDHDKETYSRLWIDSFNAIENNEERDAFMCDALKRARDFPPNVLEYLSWSLVYAIRRDLADTAPKSLDKSEELPIIPNTDYTGCIINLIDCLPPRSELSAYWCRRYHQMSLYDIAKTNDTPNFESAKVYLEAPDEGSYKESLSLLYEYLFAQDDFWQASKERNNKENAKIEKAVSAALKMNDDKRAIALLTYGKQAIAYQKIDNFDGECAIAEIMERIIRGIPQKKDDPAAEVFFTDDCPHIPESSFKETLMERLYLASLFVDDRVQSPLVSTFAQNKVAIYTGLLDYVHFDTSIPYNETWSEIAKQKTALKKNLPLLIGKIDHLGSPN